MSEYFNYVSQELRARILQVKAYVTRHNPTTGALAEEVLRQFLKEHLPKLVGVEQGFILDKNSNLSKQCDILIYDAHWYAPFYRVGGLVVIPAEAVIAIIEVKTSITKRTFHEVIDYFNSFKALEMDPKTYLFIFNALKLSSLSKYFASYPHPGDYKDFDHDTFHFLPDEITALDGSYHLAKGGVIHDQDAMGYLSYFFDDLKGTEINALEQFFISIYSHIEDYIKAHNAGAAALTPRAEYHQRKVTSIAGIDLFAM